MQQRSGSVDIRERWCRCRVLLIVFALRGRVVSGATLIDGLMKPKVSTDGSVYQEEDKIRNEESCTLYIENG